MNKPCHDLGFAKLDLQRLCRTGMSETVFCLGKTSAQLVEIFKGFSGQGDAVLGTRCTPEQAASLRAAALPITYDAVSRLVTLTKKSVAKKNAANGAIAICTGGTADIPVAEEAAQTAEFFGATVARYFDVGVAGIHRLLTQIDAIRNADVVIAVAGMEGALGSVLAGMVAVPVIAVPTSIGYGAAFAGLAPLLAMLNSCAEGLAVVNIDNGFGAGVMACRILRGKGNVVGN